MRLLSVLLTAGTLPCSTADAVSIVDRVAIPGADGIAIADGFVGRPDPGFSQDFTVQLFGGSSPAWSFLKIDGYTLNSPDDSWLSITIEDCFLSNGFCGVGSLSADGLTFSGRLATALPTPPDADGFYTTDLPTSLFTTTQVESSRPVPYRFTRFDPFRTAAVPEPATWASMLRGFALMGVRIRTRRRRAVHARPPAAITGDR